MTRISKKAQRRAVSPRKPKKGAQKTGSKKDNLPQGYKVHENAFTGEENVFIPKIK